MLGNNWSFSYDIFHNTSGSASVVHWGEGTCIPYTKVMANYNPPAGIYDKLATAGSGWTVTKKDGTVYAFNSEGYLTSVEDRNGNTITLTLNGNYFCTKITDPTGRYVTINYNGSHEI